MENNNIDKIFKDKVESLNRLPREVKWNKKIGWENYSKTFLNDKHMLKKRTVYISSAAAIILILITIILFNTHNSTQYIIVENTTNKTKKITLPDDNGVWLNKNTKITYPSKIKGKECNIKIEGEAYFEINKKSCDTYIISAQNALITVQDKSNFNIRAYTKEVNVDITVKTGIVKVGEKNNKEGLALLIKKDHYCSVHKSAKLVFSAVNQNENYLTWKTGKFVFNNTPVITITELLSEYYGKQVIVENEDIAYCLVTNSFYNIPLEEILNEIKNQLKLEIKNAGNKIILSGKSCYY